MSCGSSRLSIEASMLILVAGESQEIGVHQPRQPLYNPRPDRASSERGQRHDEQHQTSRGQLFRRRNAGL